MFWKTYKRTRKALQVKTPWLRSTVFSCTVQPSLKLRPNSSWLFNIFFILSEERLKNLLTKWFHFTVSWMAGEHRCNKPSPYFKCSSFEQRQISIAVYQKILKIKLCIFVAEQKWLFVSCFWTKFDAEEERSLLNPLFINCKIFLCNHNFGIYTNCQNLVGNYSAFWRIKICLYWWCEKRVRAVKKIAAILNLKQVSGKY